MSERIVAVLGASPKRERYSNRAVRMLQEQGFRVIPVHPAVESIEGIPAAAGLGEIRVPVDTLTVYLSPRNSLPLADEIAALRPGRVILNPGTESDALERRLEQENIPYLHACSLVLLSTGRF